MNLAELSLAHHPIEQPLFWIKRSLALAQFFLAQSDRHSGCLCCLIAAKPSDLKGVSKTLERLGMGSQHAKSGLGLLMSTVEPSAQR